MKKIFLYILILLFPVFTYSQISSSNNTVTIGGVTGSTGDVWYIQSINGSTPQMGYTGTIGFIGATGVTGETGAVGVTGETGATGIGINITSGSGVPTSTTINLGDMYINTDVPDIYITGATGQTGGVGWVKVN